MATIWNSNIMLFTMALYLICATGLTTTAEIPWSNYSCYNCLANKSETIIGSVIDSAELEEPLAQRSCMHRWQRVTLTLCNYCTNETLHNDRLILRWIVDGCRILRMHDSCYKCLKSKLRQVSILLFNELNIRGQFHNATFCTEFVVEQLGQQNQHCHFNETPCTEVPVASWWSFAWTEQYCTEILNDFKWLNTFAWIDLSVSMVAALSSVVTLAVLYNKDTVGIDALRTLLTALNVTDVLRAASRTVDNVLLGMQVRGVQMYIADVAVAVKYLDPVGMMLVMFSTYLHVLITVERWLAFCRPFYYRRVMRSARRLLASILCVAVLSVAFYAPEFWYSDILPVSGTNLRYEVDNELMRNNAYGHFVLYAVVQLAVPLALIVPLNGHIAAVALAARRYKMVHGANEMEQSADLRLAAMCASIAVSFILLNTGGLSLRLPVVINQDAMTPLVSMGLLCGGGALHISGAFANDLLCFAFMRKYRLAVKGWLRAVARLAKRAKGNCGAGTSTPAGATPAADADVAETHL